MFLTLHIGFALEGNDQMSIEKVMKFYMKYWHICISVDSHKTPLKWTQKQTSWPRVNDKCAKVVSVVRLLRLENWWFFTKILYFLTTAY